MTERTPKDDKLHERGFAAGIAVACSTMLDVWGEEVAVVEILRGAGLDTRRKMKALGVDDYDLDILNPAFKIIRERRKHRRANGECASTKES